MALTRVLQTASATLTRTVYVDETPTDVTGSMTVTVTRLDGTAVATGTASHGATGVYTYILPGGPSAPASATWQLDILNITWTGTVGGAAVTMTDQVEVVGGFLFGLAEARASDPSLTNTTIYPTSALAATRIRVEQECERICRRAFVPRFRRLTLNGTGTCAVRVPDSNIRTLRSVLYTWWTGTPMQAFAAGELARTVETDGELVRGFNIWPRGISNVIVEYEYGLDIPPEDIRAAAMIRLRSLLNQNRTGVASNALSYTTPEGTFRMAMPGARATGIPEVDAVYQRYTDPLVGTL